MKSIKKISLILLFAMIFSVFAFNFAVSAEDEVKANPSGAYIKYTVNVSKKDTQDNPNLAYNFYTLKRLDYIIQEGDMLEYDVYSYVDEKGWGAIDGEISTVGSIRDAGLSDTDGTGVHTGGDLSGYCFEQWYHRVIPFGVTEDENPDKFTVGRTLKQIQLAMHPEGDENDFEGVVLYDNIVITNNGEVKLVIFQNEEDFVEGDLKFSHSQGTDKGLIEMLVFTPEDEQAFKDAEEAKRLEEESREASRAEAEASKEASREQASIDASIAESEAANNTAAIDEEPTDNSGSSSAEGTSNMLIIIILAVGIPAVIIIVIVAIVVGSKKKGKK